MPWSFLRLVVSDGFAWYGFVEGKTLRFRFLFASEPVDDFLSVFFLFEFKYSTFYSAEHMGRILVAKFSFSAPVCPRRYGPSIPSGIWLGVGARYTPVLIGANNVQIHRGRS